MGDIATGRTRWIATGAVIAIALGAIGMTTVGAEPVERAALSSGDRGAFVPVDPCRVADTRSPTQVGPQGTPLAAGSLVVQVTGRVGSCFGGAGVPAEATAVSLNVTALNATERTFLTVWGDGAQPDTSNLNPIPGAAPSPNAVITPLAADGSVNIANDAGEVNVIVDVNGYFVPHDHDDRHVVRPDSIALSAAAFQRTGRFDTDSEWRINPTLFHTPTGSAECIVAPVDAPLGSTIGAIEFGFRATGDATVLDVTLVMTDAAATQLIDVQREVLDADLVAPSNVSNDLTRRAVGAPAGITVENGQAYSLRLCTAGRLELYTVNVVLT